MNVGVLLFQDFETLDVFGPVEILGRLTEHYKVSFYSLSGGIARNMHGIAMHTEPLSLVKNGVDIFLLPGGHGTRREVTNGPLIDLVAEVANSSKYVCTVCTGSALLAKTGLLDGRQATTNKRAFDWVITNGPAVNWVRKARWTVDGKYYTSAGVSAGMDMTLGLLGDLHGQAFAREVARHIEYTWNEDRNADEFSK